MKLPIIIIMISNKGLTAPRHGMINSIVRRVLETCTVSPSWSNTRSECRDPGKKWRQVAKLFSQCYVSMSAVCNLIANRKLYWTMVHKFHFYVIFFWSWFTKMTGITNPLHDILLWHVWRIFTGYTPHCSARADRSSERTDQEVLRILEFHFVSFGRCFNGFGTLVGLNVL